jgi:hypothetical protein
MYELPNMVFAWVLLLLRPRVDAGGADLATLQAENDALRAENARLRSQPVD